MKKIKVLMILALSLVMASCANDTYESKRHPEENEESQVTDKAEDTNEESTDEENTKENEKADMPEEKEEDKNSDVMAGVDYQVEDIVNIRLDPTTDSEIVGEAHPGDEILVLLEKDGWSRVSVNGQAGYIKSDLLKPVE